MDLKAPLKWNNHASSLLNMIQVKAPYADASIACDGKIYEVHRMILSSSSDYFNEIFKQTTIESPFLILADVESKHLEYLLNYMYKGEVNVSQCEIGPLLDTADYLKIKGLAHVLRNRDSLNDKEYTFTSKDDDGAFSPPRKKKKINDIVSIMHKRKQNDNETESMSNSAYNYGYHQYMFPEEKTKEDGNYCSNLIPMPPHKMNERIPNYEPVAQDLSMERGFIDHFAKPYTTIVPSQNESFLKPDCPTSSIPSCSFQVEQQHHNQQQQQQQQQQQPPQQQQQLNSEFITEGKANVETEENTQLEEDLSNEDLETDISDAAYSSDDDPVMVSKIRKIVRKTYKDLMLKMRKRCNSSLGVPLTPGRKFITISTINRVDGRRITARVNYCYFCNSPQTQIWRHIKIVHKAEPSVVRICDLNDEMEQRQEIDMLRNRGNFDHNKEVLRAGNGELKVYRRPDNNTQLSYKDFTPCPKCLLFLSRNDLWRHCRYRCMVRSLASDGRGPKGSFRHLLFMSYAVLGLQSNLKRSEKKILSLLPNDEISAIAAKDEIIMHLGSYLSDNLREDRLDAVRLSMRLAAKVLFLVRHQTNQHHASLSQVLRPIHLDHMIAAISIISQNLPLEEPNSDLASLDHIGISAQIEILLRKCLAVKLGIALKTHSEEEKVDVRELESSLDKFYAHVEPFETEEKSSCNFLEIEMEDPSEEDGLNADEGGWEAESVLEDLFDFDQSHGDDTPVSPQNNRSVAALKRIPYTPMENEAILKYFKEQIEKGQMIRKEDIEKLFLNPTYEGELNNRSWKNIKYKVHNLIQKKNKGK